MQWLSAQGVSVRATREPGGTPVGEAVRAILLDPHLSDMTARTEALLMFAARAQHVETVIQPALAQGQWVVSDRFVDASYAYQGAARGLGFERIDQLAQWTLRDCFPDRVLLFDLSIEESLRRMKARSTEQDRFEREAESFFKQVRAAYLKRAEQFPERYVIIDASRSREEVEDQWKQALIPLLN